MNIAIAAAAALALLLLSKQNPNAAQRARIANADQVVGGAPPPDALESRYNPPGPVVDGMYQELPLSNAQGTFVNTQVSANVSDFQPLASQTPATFSGSLPSIGGFQESVQPINYGSNTIINETEWNGVSQSDLLLINPLTITPTSYSYVTPPAVTIITEDVFPQPQYLLDQKITGAGSSGDNIITASSF